MASVAPESGELAPETKRPWKLCSETMQVKVIVVVMTVVMAALGARSWACSWRCLVWPR